MRVFIFGTRPEIIKFAPLIEEIPAVLIHTGQHKELAEEALDIFGIKPDYNFNLMTDNQRVSDFTAKCFYRLNYLIKTNKVEEIWVQGDTMTAFAGALAAYTNGIKLVHLEAGIRSHDIKNPEPEEMFRMLIDRMADVHLCPLKENAVNLMREGIRVSEENIVGNTVVNALESIRSHIMSIPLVRKPYVLATIHRREAIGEPMRQIFRALKRISQEVPVIFPCHLNPNVRELAKEVSLKITSPIGYRTFLWYLAYASLVITDSGGIVEEAPSFGVPVLITRLVSDRPKYYGEIVGYDENKIYEKYKEWFGKKGDGKNPYYDPDCVKKIKKVCGIS